MSTVQATNAAPRVRSQLEATQIHGVEFCVVTQEAQLRLCASPYFALRSLTCVYRFGRLHLDGTVPTYFIRQMAQETIRTVDGVELIVNRVVVWYCN